MDTVNPSTLAEQGKKEYEQGNYLAAAGRFAQAAQAYTLMKDELNAAEMKCVQCGRVGCFRRRMPACSWVRPPFRRLQR